MKSYFLLIFFCAIYSVAFGQVAIQNNQTNLLYLGQPNPLTIAVGGYKSEDVTAQTNNGKIVAGTAPGAYVITPTSEGEARVEVYLKTGKGQKMVGSQVYNVKGIPLIAVRIDTNTITPTTPLVSIAQSLIIGLDIDSKWKLTRFVLTVTRNGTEIFSKTCSNRNGVKFDDEIKLFFLSLKEGDIVSLDELMAMEPTDDVIRNLWPCHFRITKTTGLYEQYNGDPKFIDLVDPITGQTVRKQVNH